MMQIKPTIPDIETFKQRRLRKKAVKRSMMTPKQKQESHNNAQKSYFESVGRYNNDKDKRDARYDAEIAYIKEIDLEVIPTSWKDKLSLILENDTNTFIKKTARLKTYAIKCVYAFKQDKLSVDNAIEKMLGSMQ
jgi:hypothetical protein